MALSRHLRPGDECPLAQANRLFGGREDVSADVTVDGHLPLFVFFLASNWGYVLFGLIVFLIIGMITDATKHPEMKRLKEKLKKHQAAR